MGKAVTIGQSHNLISVLANNVDWEALPGDIVQQIIDSPRGAGVRFTAFLKNGARLIVAEPSGSFSRDMRKEGWTLLENSPRRLTSTADFEAVSFLRDGEEYIRGEEVVRRARIELDANYGQEDAEFLLEHQEEIPAEFRNFYLVFTATVWRRSFGVRCVSCLLWSGGRWVLDFVWLGRDWRSDGRLVRPRK